ncbi:MAG TPA: hypothetical protein VE090_00895 [Methylomirabilota bacterium]|nr:hypothetical protein [Methylomirabilota bacterium]
MAQHIGIEKVNERGEILNNFHVNFAAVVNILEEIDEYQKKYPWIATIDPYGDTIFNRIQIPFVVEDLKKLQKDKDELTNTINELIDFFEKVDIHEYLKFIGD